MADVLDDVPPFTCFGVDAVGRSPAGALDDRPLGAGASITAMMAVDSKVTSSVRPPKPMRWIGGTAPTASKL